MQNKSTVQQSIQYILVAFLLFVYGNNAIAESTTTILCTGSYNTGSVNATGTKTDGSLANLTSAGNRSFVHFNLSSIPVGSLIPGLNVSGTSQTVTGLSAGTAYYYRVRADKTSVTGQGNYSSTLSTAICANSSSTTDKSICLSELPYTWNGLTFNAAGSQTAHLTNASGCDSAATLNLTVVTLPAPAINIIGSANICDIGSVTLDAVSTSNAGRFADSVIDFSSQYPHPAWFATQVLGLPNVYPTYGDNFGNWASASENNSREYLVLGFANPAPINFVNIYETYNPGSVDTVYVKNPGTGLFEIVYTNTAVAAPQKSRILQISFPLTSYNVSEIRIAMNSPAVAGWNEIDAVGIGNNTGSNLIWSPGSITGSSITVSVSGSYTVTETNDIGCVATSTPVVVTVNHASNSTIDSSICSSSLPFAWNGLTFFAAGSQTAHLTNVGGCDSTAILNVTIKANYSVTASVSGNGSITNSGISTVCSGDNSATYIIAANTGNHIVDVLVDGISQGAITTYTFNNVTANHTISASFTSDCEPTSSTTNASICVGGIFLFAGNTYTTANTYLVHLTNLNGCDSAATLNLTVTSLSTPSISIVADGNNVCAGTNITFTATPVNGGTAPTYQWKINGVNVGTNSSIFSTTALNSNDSVWCVLTSNSACVTTTTATSNTMKMILKAIPGTPVINANSILLNCAIGSSTSMACNYWNTTWSSSNPSVATVTYPGIEGTNGTYVNGLSNGITVITVTVINTATGCSTTSSINYTVAAATAGTITASNSVCLNSSISATNNVGGGVWSFSNSKALVSNTGVVTGNSVGSGVLTYKVSNASGCYASATKSITINALPIVKGANVFPAIKNKDAVCPNRTYQFTGNPSGGVWTSNNAAVATITSAGLMNTIGIGNAIITYTLTDNNGCSSSKGFAGATVVACVARETNPTNDQEPKIKDMFSIYPNPAKGVVSLQVDKRIGEGMVVITDVYGKVVYTSIVNSPSTKVDIRHLHQGLYFVSIISKEGKVTKKLIVE